MEDSRCIAMESFVVRRVEAAVVYRFATTSISQNLKNRPSNFRVMVITAGAKDKA